MTDGVGSQQQAEGLTTGVTEFLGIDLGKEPGMIEFDGPRQVLAQQFPAQVQKADLHQPFVVTFRRLVGQHQQTAPVGFQGLELRVVEDRVELLVE